MELLKTQGLVLIDVDVVALNNAGASTTTNFDNGVATKTITKNGKKYAYVSGQAWRYWWRDTLKKDCEDYTGIDVYVTSSAKTCDNLSESMAPHVKRRLSNTYKIKYTRMV